MTYETLYDWMWWLSAASIVGGLYGFVVLAVGIIHDAGRSVAWLVRKVR